MQSYFQHGGYSTWMVAHSTLMILAWAFVMPLAIMLSIARSRWHLPAQGLFHTINGLGVLTGFVFNHATPDLYEGNAHHPLGWVLTWFTVAWTVMSVYTALGARAGKEHSPTQMGREAPASNAAQHGYFSQYNDDVSPTRMSRDSGLGNSRQNSQDSILQKKEQTSPLYPLAEDVDLDDEEKYAAPETRGFLGLGRAQVSDSGLLRKSTQRLTTIARTVQVILEKTMLLLGFTAIATGFVVYGGIFRDLQVLSGLAHYIKGAIFFFYGLLTLGRWMGAFAEFGWAWNLRPSHPAVAKWKARIPSAEFVESFVIWLYGVSNVFLERLGSDDSSWSPQQLEHVSITVLFFGGGLFGMMIESSWAKELMSATVFHQKDRSAEREQWEQPHSYRVSMNPMPALTIMLLGMMMSSHHQASMVSTMLHSQWGGLFSAFAMARGVTYVSMYLKPPTSHFAGRPPSEIVAAWCLTSGGLIFMNSASDSVWSIESSGLDAMTVFTITMGVTGILLAWEVIVFAIKGWAVRKEGGKL
ncbi:uncharacterized protein K489DRAFT_315317 [Dissoconium aciculare CBS 342.82]|uniref:Integral membrane protein n=1 Tax=Dissoconium aciculare CBS 342.82 TaxID=1314786 RepID=A0A6J3MAE2_9PEZI|nr:uncharacterized protein K489DRAFT_315317 [Dissoconium aciculare CBS 342.82]KAF1824996.1 hypothetical protein K489DRAFT_315317 [Dissoconium aciculare CBS 342.82]